MKIPEYILTIEMLQSRDALIGNTVVEGRETKIIGKLTDIIEGERCIEIVVEGYKTIEHLKHDTCRTYGGGEIYYWIQIGMNNGEGVYIKSFGLKECDKCKFNCKIDIKKCPFFKEVGQ